MFKWKKVWKRVRGFERDDIYINTLEIFYKQALYKQLSSDSAKNQAIAKQFWAWISRENKQTQPDFISQLLLVHL